MCAPGRFRIPAVRPIRIDCPSTCRTCKKSETGNRVSGVPAGTPEDRKSTRLNSSHSQISYAVFCLKKKSHHHRYRIKQGLLPAIAGCGCVVLHVEQHDDHLVDTAHEADSDSPRPSRSARAPADNLV